MKKRNQPTNQDPEQPIGFLTQENDSPPSPIRAAKRALKRTFYRFIPSLLPSSSLLARKSILFPLASSMGPTFRPPDEAATAVLCWWRNLVAELHQAEVGRFKHAKFAGLAMNCYPSMALPDRNVPRLFCGGLMCPWCSGRESIWLGHRLGADSVEDWKTYAVNRKVMLSTLDVDLAAWSSVGTIRAQTEAIAKCCRAFTAVHRECLDGSFWRIFFEPSPGGELAIRMRMASVRAVDRGDIFLYPRGWSVSECDAMDRTSVNEVIRETSHYPVGLTRVTVDLLSSIILARDGMRLSESSGLFREKSPWKTL